MSQTFRRIIPIYNIRYYENIAMGIYIFDNIIKEIKLLYN